MPNFGKFRGNLISQTPDFENFREIREIFFPRKFLPLRYLMYCSNIARVITEIAMLFSSSKHSFT